MLCVSKATLGNLRCRVGNSLARSQVQQRFNLSSSQQQATEKAQNAYASSQSKAGKALEGAKQVGQSVSGRIGNMLGSYREPVMYNLAVAREVLKQVYVAERLTPPTSFAEIKTAYSTIFERVRHISFWREVMRSGEWAKLVVYGLEAYGIFKIGEMAGRRNIVGYKLE